jgi:hypothetical protein
MQPFFLAAIVVIAFLSPVTGSPRNVATWIVSILMTVGVFTSPGWGMRLAFVVVTLLSPVIRMLLRNGWALTVQPLVFYFRHRFVAHRSLVALEPGDALSLAAAPQLEKHVRDAVALGFQSRGRATLAIARSPIVTELLERDEGRLWVSLTIVLRAKPEPVILDCWVRLASGETLTVNNSARVSSSAVVPGFLFWRLPSLTRVADVVRACEGVAERTAAIMPVPLETDLLTLLHSRTREHVEGQRRAGYYRYDAIADVYRPTLKGAYRLYWMLLPPLNGFFDRRDRERERTLLTELGMTPIAERAMPVSIVAEYRQHAPAIALLILIALLGLELPKWIASLLL